MDNNNVLRLYYSHTWNKCLLVNPLSHKYNHLPEMEALHGLTEVHPGIGNHEAEELCDDRTLKVVNVILNGTAM